MKNLLQRARKTIKIKNMLFLTIAGIINAFGITIFLNPVNLYDSGISGTAMLANLETVDNKVNHHLVLA